MGIQPICELLLNLVLKAIFVFFLALMNIDFVILIFRLLSQLFNLLTHPVFLLSHSFSWIQLNMALR